MRSLKKKKWIVYKRIKKSVGTITIIMKELSILSERSKKTPTVFKVNNVLNEEHVLPKFIDEN